MDAAAAHGELVLACVTCVCQPAHLLHSFVAMVMASRLVLGLCCQLHQLHQLVSSENSWMQDAVNALDFHPSGKQLASASRDRTVCVWKVSS